MSRALRTGGALVQGPLAQRQAQRKGRRRTERGQLAQVPPVGAWPTSALGARLRLRRLAGWHRAERRRLLAARSATLPLPILRLPLPTRHRATLRSQAVAVPAKARAPRPLALARAAGRAPGCAPS